MKALVRGFLPGTQHALQLLAEDPEQHLRLLFEMTADAGLVWIAEPYGPHAGTRLLARQAEHEQAATND